MAGWRCKFVAFLGLVSVGCARGPAVSADGLALRRVVVYRNGVGYFERQGHVADDRVDFKVRGREVGDFLATLAVIERGGSSVRAASFPIHTDDADSSTKPGSDSDPPHVGTGSEKLETVVLELDGKEHDLQVGYIAETPVWRPSYRLIVGSSGADLQEWGIVQNLSGEDWKGVSLSLIAGAPLAFHASLGTPVIPDRPTVTDEGEVIAAVPTSETSLNQQVPAEKGATVMNDEAAGAPAAASEPPASRPAPTPAQVQKLANSVDRLKDAVRSRRARLVPLSETIQPPAPPPPANPSAPRNLTALAGVAVNEGSTRYDIPDPVTVPDNSATMVMLLSKQVPGESIYLFAADPGVPDSQTHPFRVARFTNRSGGLLERGPIAVFEDGAFLGQGMVDPLPDNATATVPFALERSLAVEHSQDSVEEGARVGKIEAGELTIERDAVTRTKYRVRNGGEKAAKLLVKHARAQSTILFEPPVGTEDNVGTGSALVPVNVAPHATSDLTVAERRIIRRDVDWLSPFADDAVRAYWIDRRADPSIVAKLKAAWDIRSVLVRVSNQQAKLAPEKQELESGMAQTRENLKALEKLGIASDLRVQLTQRLAKDALRLEAIMKETIGLDQQQAEQRVRFLDIVRSIKLTMPPPVAAGE